MAPLRLVGLVLVASLPVLSGCTAAAAGTALAERSPADGAGKAWNPDAQLVGIVGVEGRGGWMGAAMMGMWAGMGNDTAMARDGGDARVGDGVCEVWMYGYAVPGQPGVHVVMVDKDGKVVRQGDMAMSSPAQPLGAWKVNSDEALRIAKQGNEGVRRGVESQNFGVFEMLAHMDGREHATWHIAAGGGDATQAGGGQVVIDAVTGDILENRGGFAGV